MTETKALSVAIQVPDIDSLPDGELYEIAHMRDGRWSGLTKTLLEQFGTTKLDLNSGWASTWTGWSCPCCRREKPQMARMSPGGVLLCRLEFHHDHIGDLTKRIFRERNARSEDRDINIQVSRAKDALLPLVERFEPTLICIDCNLAEGRAKLELTREIDADFTFAPSEIATFITAGKNRTHEIDVEKARTAWLAARDDFTDRTDFATRMAQRIAGGRHRREVAPGQRLLGPIQERDIVYRLFAAAVPPGYRHRLGTLIEARSVSNDSAGQSPKPKRKAVVRSPTDSEFAAVEAAQGETKAWIQAGPDWLCPSCGRSKREICRKSNRGKWTARIHRVVDFLPEDDEESFTRRRSVVSSQIIIGSYRRVLICHDCRNVTAELLRRKAGFDEQCLTLDDLRELVEGAAPHSPHQVDFEQATAMAIANAPLREAIEAYEDHRSRAIEVLADVKSTMKLMGWSWSKARDIVGYELAKAHGWELDEGDIHADWLLRETRRGLDLDEAEA
ncbi:hypothetical protein BjapCC829_49705 (plasmid) [Bradyrhizobium barranii]|uniref:Uncharacterized protein n=1 Tax=Bradyrhizobium barranii TaxID=2992140 RepID=A0ABY3R168_9BRAD|nr:hypothetical protein [Bradyrhizobium japonicum]UFW92025.1 hypothetical protein BjapCC829_49705 [Bradyrhizobium japonicum]